jgi:hypothetical protein
MRIVAALFSVWWAYTAVIGVRVASAQSPPAPSLERKVTVNDPDFIPLEGEKAIGKGVPWYVYVLGAALIGGVAAAAGGGGGGGTSSTTTGTVTGTW